MPTLAEILSNELGLAVKAIQDNMDRTDFNASNETKNSLEFEVSEKGNTIIGTISGAGGLRWAETGRPPRTSNASSGLAEKILTWMGTRNIGSNLSEKGKEGLARFITLRINQLGTKLWREKGSRGERRDVYSKVLDDTMVRIKEDMGDVISALIRKEVNVTFEKV